VAAVPFIWPSPSAKEDTAVAGGSQTEGSRPDVLAETQAVELAAAAQREYSQRLGLPVEVTNSIGMQLAMIPPGEFLMGSPESEPEAYRFEKPQHRVTITEPFYLGVHEVTIGQFRRFVNATGYRTQAERDGRGGSGWDESTGELVGPDPRYCWRTTGFTQTDEHPVVNVSWNDAVAFGAWLAKTENKRYRLPTEAEWEYACRAGTTTRYFCGNDPEQLVQVGNVPDGCIRRKLTNGYPRMYLVSYDGYVYTAPVGSFQPNEFGLHDMHGNVFEWCQDWFGTHYKQSDLPAEDPMGPQAGTARVTRGGAWRFFPLRCQSSSRVGLVPGTRNTTQGFRLALVAGKASGR
jgi:formylglycine-generating enzyme required for sulfatase activity